MSTEVCAVCLDLNDKVRIEYALSFLLSRFFFNILFIHFLTSIFFFVPFCIVGTNTISFILIQSHVDYEKKERNVM